MSDDKLIFAITADATGCAMLIMGIPEKAWDHMKDGKTNHLDLTKVGFPLKVIAFGGKDRGEIMRTIEAHNKSVGAATLYHPGRDYGIDGMSAPKSSLAPDVCEWTKFRNPTRRWKTACGSALYAGTDQKCRRCNRPIIFKEGEMSGPRYDTRTKHPAPRWNSTLRAVRRMRRRVGRQRPPR